MKSRFPRCVVNLLLLVYALYHVKNIPVAVSICSVSCQEHTLAIHSYCLLGSIAQLSQVCAAGPVLFEKC